MLALECHYFLLLRVKKRYQKSEWKGGANCLLWCMYLFIELTLNTYQCATGRIWGELVTCMKLGTLRDKKGDPYDKVTGVPHPYHRTGEWSLRGPPWIVKGLCGSQFSCGVRSSGNELWNSSHGGGGRHWLPQRYCW